MTSLKVEFKEGERTVVYGPGNSFRAEFWEKVPFVRGQITFPGEAIVEIASPRRGLLLEMASHLIAFYPRIASEFSEFVEVESYMSTS